MRGRAHVASRERQPGGSCSTCEMAPGQSWLGFRVRVTVTVTVTVRVRVRVRVRVTVRERVRVRVRVWAGNRVRASEMVPEP